MQLAARRRDPRQVAAAAQVLVREGPAVDVPHHEQPGVGDVLEHRRADARLRGGPRVEVLGRAVDREQLAPRLGDPDHDRAAGVTDLQVDVGQAAGEHLHRARLPAQARHVVKHAVPFAAAGLDGPGRYLYPPGSRIPKV